MDKRNKHLQRYIHVKSKTIMHVDVIYIQKIKSPIWIPQQWSVKTRTPYMHLGVYPGVIDWRGNPGNKA